MTAGGFCQPSHRGCGEVEKAGLSILLGCCAAWETDLFAHVTMNRLARLWNTWGVKSSLVRNRARQWGLAKTLLTRWVAKGQIKDKVWRCFMLHIFLYYCNSEQWYDLQATFFPVWCLWNIEGVSCLRPGRWNYARWKCLWFEWKNTNLMNLEETEQLLVSQIY